MLEALILAQTVFYFTVSLAIIVVGVLCAVVAYHLVRIARELEEISRNLNSAASEAGERVREIIDRLSELPILSYFLKRELKREERESKGRGKVSRKSHEEK